MSALPDTTPQALARALPEPLRGPAQTVLTYIQQGTFQRSMALLVCASSAVSTIEVGYEHYRGSYSNPIMYTPVVLSGTLTVAAAMAFFSRPIAQTALRWNSITMLIDGLVGFGFHIRGVARKPGGWRLPIVNIVMGPPLFAPLLAGTAAYLGFLASYLQREEDAGTEQEKDDVAQARGTTSWRKDIETGQFQKHLCVVTAMGTLCSGGEAWYSHYKDNFKFRVQWSPIYVAAALAGAAVAAIPSRTAANTALPLTAAAAMLNGAIGTGFHIRGILRRPGGSKKPLYNTLYGPPIFAPMLFSACGLVGMLAYLMRRERTA